MKIELSTIVKDLESLRGNRVLVYYLTKQIADQDVVILYNCLRSLKRQECLDVILHSVGGSVNVARRIALLFRDYTKKLNILVPYKALSAGTLLCLTADQLVLGSLAELSPLDPQIESAIDMPVHIPMAISAEDIKAFRLLASEWFNLHDDDHRMQIFALLTQQVFPLSLSTFFRAHQQMHEIADELLSYQFDATEIATRKGIIKKLVDSYHSHDYRITRKDALQLGLRVISASQQEEDLLWQIMQRCEHSTLYNDNLSEIDGPVDGVIYGSDFFAYHISRLFDRQLQEKDMYNNSTIKADEEINSNDLQLGQLVCPNPKKALTLAKPIGWRIL
jgi:hypothetical protein